MAFGNRCCDLRSWLLPQRRRRESEFLTVFELVEGSLKRLAVTGELRHLVLQDGDGDPGPDREGGLVDPFPRQWGDGSRPDEDTFVGIREEPEIAAGIVLIGRGTGD